MSVIVLGAELRRATAQQRPAICRYGLTGTAMQNDHKELWALLSWAVPQCLGDWRDCDKKYVQPLQHAQKANATDEELALVR